MLTRSTPANYRAQCTVLALLATLITKPLADPDNPTQVNPEWHADAKRKLRNRGASNDQIKSLDNWVEDENESGLLTGTTPRLPVPVTHPVQQYQHAVDMRGNVESIPTAAGVYAISGGALRIRGYVS